MDVLEWFSRPWPWYVAGPLIGLTVPALLIIGNKSFGISSSLRHICAACIPAKIPFFQYDWKKEMWNLFFVGGIFFGGLLAMVLLKNPDELIIAEGLKTELATYGINDYSGLMPGELFSLESLFSLKGLFMFVIGGFLVGFGTRYAGGCTSGHAIMGLSTLQWPSLVATCCFMAGGIIVANFVLPFILSL
ncbi:MAG: YeeE/YedE thiosulfate transporter family protein [Cytophagales bacterium]